MSENNHPAAYRMLIIVTTPKISEMATKYFERKKLPIHYIVNAVGTAPSDIMDILGIGSPDKCIIVCMLPKTVSDVLLRELYVELMFGVPGNGIAFTVPLNAANNKLMKIMNSISEDNFNSCGKEELIMSEIKRIMITAVINPGFSDAVMKAAKSAGAKGGTIIHARGVSDEESINQWGLGLQEEKEIVMIVAESQNKLAIMEAISNQCGINTEANGFVTSMPIDTVIGLRTGDN